MSTNLTITEAALSAGEATTSREVPTFSDWVNSVLPRYADKELLSVLRMNRATFNKLVSEVEDHPAFSHDECPVDVQVAVLLKRLGGLMHYYEVGTLFGISTGVVKVFCMRSITAIIDVLGPRYPWPDDAESLDINALLGSLRTPGRLKVKHIDH